MQTNFLSLKYGDMELGEQRQESEDEGLTNLDNRIEMERAGQEPAHLVMGTIFLVLVQNSKFLLPTRTQ